MRWPFQLALLLALSVFLAFYPYSWGVNSGLIPVGVDVIYYASALHEVKGDLAQYFFKPWCNERPLIFLLIESLRMTLGLSEVDAVKFVVFILDPLFVLSCFVLAWRAAEDFEVGVLGALFGLLGVQFTCFTYCYYLANLLALIELNFALALFFDGLRRGSWRLCLAGGLTGSLATFTHPWTWIFYYAAVAASTLWALRGRDWFSFRLTAFMLVPGLVLDAFKTFGLGALGGVSSAVLTVAHPRPAFAPLHVFEFWSGMIFTFRLLYGGALACLVYWILILIGVHRLAVGQAFSPYVKRFFLSLLVFTCILFPFSASHIYSRLVFDLPLFFLAALGFKFLGERASRFELYVLWFFLLTVLAVFVMGRLANLV